MANNLHYLSSLKEVSGETFFKQFTDTLPHIISVVSVDDFKIQYINRILPGFSVEQVLGMDVFAFVWPEYHDDYKRLIRESAETRITMTLESIGASTEGKAWYRTFFTPIPNKDNDVKCVMLIAEDITESKQKSLELLDKGEKLKAVINNTNDIICSIDLNYQLTEFNAVFESIVVNGLKIQPKTGMPVLNFIDPTKHENLKSIYQKVAQGENCHKIEKFQQQHIGGFVYHESWYNPIRNNESEVVGINIFSKDITQRIEGEEKLKNALKEKDILLSEIHHRIKNNLAIVSSMLNLQELNMKSDEAKDALSQSRKRIRSTALVHELLYRRDSFARIEFGEYIRELYSLLKSDKGFALQVTGHEVLIGLETAMPLGLLFNELLMNSIKHSYNNINSGVTKIHLAIVDKSLFITYEDSHGSFPIHLDFYKPNSVGLTLIHTFIQQLGGKIQIANKAPLAYKMQIPYHER